jgi:chromosomal replication initiator protein
MMARLDATVPDRAAPGPLRDADFATLMETAITERIGEQRFQLWFRGHTQFRLDGDVLTVGVPNLHYQEWLARNFSGPVGAAAEAVLDRPVQARFRILPQLFQAHRAAEQQAAQHADLNQPSAALPQWPTEDSPAAPALPPSARPKATSSPGLFDRLPDSAAGARRRQAGKRRWRHLSAFVAGPCNRVAFAAALSIVEEPAQAPNPLVVHGPVGTGKSHLLEGIFAGLKRRDANLHVLYLTAEDFTNRFVAAMRFGKQPAFRRHFRSCDVLLLDDLHFLARKRATQEEFLHTLNALLEDGRQVVVSCDCHPRLHEEFLPELLDRLLGGAIWGLQPPDAETRLAILRAKAGGRDKETRRQGDGETGRDFSIPDGVLQFVAENLRGNIRELEGALYSLRHYSRVMQRSVDLPMAREALGELLRHCVRVTTMKDVDAAVCAVLRLPPGTLQGKERSWSVSHPRMLAVFLSRKHTAASYAEIGKHFGGKGHSNAVAAEKKVRRWIETNEVIAAGGREWPVRELMERMEREMQR